MLKSWLRYCWLCLIPLSYRPAKFLLKLHVGCAQWTVRCIYSLESTNFNVLHCSFSDKYWPWFQFSTWPIGFVSFKLYIDLSNIRFSVCCIPIRYIVCGVYIIHSALYTITLFCVYIVICTNWTLFWPGRRRFMWSIQVLAT